MAIIGREGNILGREENYYHGVRGELQNSNSVVYYIVMEIIQLTTLLSDHRIFISIALKVIQLIRM